jgi:hypothetical protein
MQSRLVRLATPLRALLIVWIIAGTAYMVASPSRDTIPPIVGLALAAPFLLSVPLLMLWNIYRVVYWVVGKSEP